MDDIVKDCIRKGYVPWFKSQIIRVAILDLIRGYGPGDLIRFLDSQEDLGGDLKALRRIAEAWVYQNKSLDVGESATIYRFVSFYSWKYGISRPIVVSGTLAERAEEMGATPDIVNWPLAKLLTLEGGTTQWATMAILMGNKEVLPQVPFYIQQTYNVMEHYDKQRDEGKVWIPQRDITLSTQIEEYIRFLKTGKTAIKPTKLGDCDLACFLMAFGIITPGEAKDLWPMIQFHESNRVKAMREALEQLLLGNIICTDDHRVVQALAMLIQSKNLSISADDIRKRFHNPNCVNKTWPRFWDFLADVPRMLRQEPIE
jgi:hypothetical protein